MGKPLCHINELWLWGSLFASEGNCDNGNVLVTGGNCDNVKILVTEGNCDCGEAFVSQKWIVIMVKPLYHRSELWLWGSLFVTEGNCDNMKVFLLKQGIRIIGKHLLVEQVIRTIENILVLQYVVNLQERRKSILLTYITSLIIYHILAFIYLQTVQNDMSSHYDRCWYKIVCIFICLSTKQWGI